MLSNVYSKKEKEIKNDNSQTLSNDNTNDTQINIESSTEKKK